MTTLTIYHGLAKPMRAVGKNQCRLLAFAEKYHGWHSYKTDSATLRAINALKAKGYIEINEHGQFKITYQK